MLFGQTIAAFADDAAGSTTESAAAQSFDWAGLWKIVVDWLCNTGIKLVIAVVLMIVTFKIVNVLTKRLYKRLQNKHADETLARVGTQILRIFFKILILVCLVGYVGIETASISAVIASLGIGVSMAVQGTLSNFAGGVIIIIMRPFKIGDYITSGDYSGTVEDIKLFYTHIVTPDNKAIMIPNGTLANNVIVNTSAKDTRRCDVTLGIAYGADLELAKSLIREVCERNELIFKEPAPFITLGELGESSVNIYTRVWCKNSDYWTVNFYLLDEIKKAFDANGVEIPFKQIDVTIKQENEKADEQGE